MKEPTNNASLERTVVIPFWSFAEVQKGLECLPRVAELNKQRQKWHDKVFPILKDILCEKVEDVAGFLLNELEENPQDTDSVVQSELTKVMQGRRPEFDLFEILME